VGELRALFSELHLTVVGVTHDQTEAFALADRLAIMSAGELVQVGPPAEVWARPASVAATRLLGFTNLAPAVLDGGRLRTAWGDLGPWAEAVGPGAQVLVRPEGLRRSPGGPIAGTVVAVTFAGARSRVEVAVGVGSTLVADLAAPEVPAVGSAVELDVDPRAVTILAG